MKKINNKIYIKIGILGGTFDPPHKGHVQISKVAIKKLKLNNLIWVITKRNPLKEKPHLSINKRIKLSKKIIGNKKIIVAFLDKKIKSNKTFDLLTYIKKKHKKAQLYFLMGADNLVSFHKWKYWEKITQLTKIVIYPRQNYSLKSLKKIVLMKLNKKDFIYLKSKKINISSSIIRKFW